MYDVTITNKNTGDAGNSKWSDATVKDVLFVMVQNGAYAEGDSQNIRFEFNELLFECVYIYPEI